MSERQFMKINGNPVEINGEKNLLELIRKVGIEMPTFCYYSELSVYGACRMCMVENSRGGFEAACSTIPRAGMEIYTNTERLRKHRKTILELLLANHCRDCTTCEKNENCKLQEFAKRFGVTNIRFPNAKPEPQLDNSSVCIVRDAHKCILCGDCVRMCNEIQNVGAIDFAHRGSKMIIATAFDKPIAESPCVGCGQCAAVCPTGAIVIKNDTNKVGKILSDKSVIKVAQIAPAVRVAIAKTFGMDDDANIMGRIVAALRKLGFDEVYDTATAADFTVVEESNEFLEKLTKGELPLFTSCCPAWVNYCEKKHPELVKHVSTCKSPMQMFSSIIKAKSDAEGKKAVNIAIMPCTAKKFEITREELKVNGEQTTDYSLTTQELIRMINEAGIVFSELEPEAVDPAFSVSSGAGVIFGVTGGVTEAVIRRLANAKTSAELQAISFSEVRGMNGVKEASIMYGDREVKICIASGLNNAEKVIQAMKNGTHYDFVEIMACPGGCVGGAGQPVCDYETKEKRGKALYSADKRKSLKRSEDNPLVAHLYNGLLKGRVHELLHASYVKKDK